MPPRAAKDQKGTSHRWRGYRWSGKDLSAPFISLTDEEREKEMDWRESKEKEKSENGLIMERPLLLSAGIVFDALSL